MPKVPAYTPEAGSGARQSSNKAVNPRRVLVLQDETEEFDNGTLKISVSVTDVCQLDSLKQAVDDDYIELSGADTDSETEDESSTAEPGHCLDNQNWYHGCLDRKVVALPRFISD